MLSSTKSILLGALVFTVMSLGIAFAEESRNIATVAFVEKAWAVALNITGYSVHLDGVTPDGRRYFFATNAVTSMTLSVTLERITGQATEQGCMTHLQHIAQTSASNI
ncbi:MAG: hypothetical protein M3M98_08210, partial [Nitrospirota bacterium]|nr:hypothetical protein [Nitrospirota bacterium]